MEEQESNKKVEDGLIDCLQRGFSWEFCSKLEDALNRLQNLRSDKKRKTFLLILLFKAVLLSAQEEVSLVL
ncbi:hypothetical protein A0127_06415 [Thermococcus peptonophilus]|uniref:Uncharacterized protein n=1 Tax=Thermococcus peptonophilus TaxID=53952 RepID=A0A142CVN0_9EURY|nr:hypothetical protein A0127_06415 [Thermococcus peptonophilus]